MIIEKYICMDLKRMLGKFAMFLLICMLVACARPAGELVGTSVSTSFFLEKDPYGMVFIKSGSFMMGENSQNPMFARTDKSVNVSVDAFWMDQTEITNSEYRQFVCWVRDSIARTLLVEAGREEYAFVPKHGTFDAENVVLDWSKPIVWENAKDEELGDIFSEMRYEDGTINTTKFRYNYRWYAYEQAALPRNRFDVRTGKYLPTASVKIDSSWVDEVSGFIYDTTFVRPLRHKDDLVSNRILCVYPDTLVWVRDFQYAYNEPMLHMYFSHQGYNDYPVAGVTWEQAIAFCEWRTVLLQSAKSSLTQIYRLPTETEWEYAARGGRRMAMYPWGTGYARDSEGCFLANFKPFRGGYADDESSITMRVATYPANDFGLYDMAGNVAEWTSSAYHVSTNNWISDMNPNYQYDARNTDPPILKRKVIKGGSWKDISYYLQCGTRTYEYQYESRPYIGFRCVRSYVGTIDN